MLDLLKQNYSILMPYLNTRINCIRFDGEACNDVDKKNLHFNC